jgi:hypothetical protein
LYGTPIKVANASGLPSLERKPEACATLATF